MNPELRQYLNHLDQGVDEVRRLTKHFAETIKLRGFAYIRIYRNGTIGWLTSDSDHDRFVFEANFHHHDPLVSKAKEIREGQYLHFHDCQFDGAEPFYQERSKRFRVDHGMILVRSEEDYIEASCFSGFMAQQPLYNIFINEPGIFRGFVDYFKQRLTRHSLSLLDHGVGLSNFNLPSHKLPALNTTLSPEDRRAIVSSCGWNSLLQISARERDCLSLLRKGFTYREIGDCLNISERTVEHYLESAKNKLGICTRSELFLEADRMFQLGLFT
jgi:DNA-binding CsgD family transcriptional regulator